MFSRSEASTLQRTELNYVLPSSRLPQYKRLAALGHNIGLPKYPCSKELSFTYKLLMLKRRLKCGNRELIFLQNNNFMFHCETF